MTRGPLLSEKKELNLMRLPGHCLVKQVERNTPVFYVVPGGQVSADVAEKIKAHPLTHAGKDALFPGMDQTWRMG